MTSILPAPGGGSLGLQLQPRGRSAGLRTRPTLAPSGPGLLCTQLPTWTGAPLLRRASAGGAGLKSHSVPAGSLCRRCVGPPASGQGQVGGKEGPGQLSLGPGQGGPALTLWCLPAGSAWSQPLSGPEKHSGGLLKGVPGFSFEVSTLCGLHSHLGLREVWDFPWNRSVEEGLQWGPQALPVSCCPTPAGTRAPFQAVPHLPV